MSTISTALKMHDQVTSVMQNMVNSMNMTLSAMEDVQSAMNTTFDNSGIEAARRSIQDAEIALRGLDSPIENAGREQEKLNRELEKGEKSSSNLLKNVIGFVGAYVGYRKVRDYITENIALANEQIKAEQRLQSIMSNIPGMTQNGIDMLKQYASELQNVTTIGDEVGIFGMSQLAQYVYDPKNIKSLSESMYNLAVETYGANVSMENIMQTANLMGKVMMGDINALSRNGFRIDAIFTEAEQQLLKTGTEAERTALLIQMIDENLNGLARAMAETPEGKAAQLANEWGDFKEALGFGFIPVWMQLMETFQRNMPAIQEIFFVVFDNIINILSSFIEMSAQIVEFFINNWSWINPVLWGTVAALSAYLLLTKSATLATKGLAIATAIYNAILNANPFVLIITLIVGLIAVLVRLWQTNDKFAAGMYRTWNGLLNFFDQVYIFFSKIEQGIVNTFMNMYVKSAEILDKFINAVIDDVNRLIELLNNIPGVSIQAIGHVEMSARAAAQAEAVRQAGESAIADLERNAALKAAQREQKVLDMLDNRAAKRAQQEAEREARFAMPDTYGNLGSGMMAFDENSLLNIDKVGEVGKIRDDVNIASEDLKTMRELAEMRSIQNFVTLRPTVQVTGDNHFNNGLDLDTMIARVTDRLEEDIASSAAAVYDV